MKSNVIPLWKALTIIVSVFLVVSLLIGGTIYYSINGNPFTVDEKQTSMASNNETETDTNIQETINGTWTMKEANNNNESIVITFTEGNFSMISETIVSANTDYVIERLEDEEAYYDDFNGSPIEVERISDKQTKVRVTTHGEFVLTENEIEMTGDDGVTTILPFAFSNDGLLIDDELYVRYEQ